MRSLFYTSLIVAGALLLVITFFPRNDFLPIFRAPDAHENKAQPVVTTEFAHTSAPSTTRVTSAADGASTPEPKVETLEELTRNWTVIPASAFPRKVRLLREAAFKSGVGSSKLPAGTEVVALACDKGILDLTPEGATTVHGMARVGDTDLKAQIRESYDRWAAARLQALRQQEAARHQADPPSSVAALDPVPGGVDESGRPVRGADGMYPVLLASMRSGQVTDITPKKVKMWGTPQLATMEGRPTWVIDVDYDTIVFCGPITARAQAHVRDGRVIRWVYPGSGEPVP